MLTDLNHREMKELKEQWWKENNKSCAITFEPLEWSQCAMDHMHKLKKERPDESGKGCCRGVIDRNINVFLGRVENGFKRSGLHKRDIELPEMLRMIADYLDTNKIHEDEKFVHPDERWKC